MCIMIVFIFQEWTDALLSYATNLLALNQSPLSYLEKTFYKISMVVGQDGKIPVKK